RMPVQALQRKRATKGFRCRQRYAIQYPATRNLLRAALASSQQTKRPKKETKISCVRRGSQATSDSDRGHKIRPPRQEHRAAWREGSASPAPDREYNQQ